MSEEKQIEKINQPAEAVQPEAAQPKAATGAFGKKRFAARPRRETRNESEFDQQVLDLARVTRVMAGGKRMRFRACVALGNHNGKVGIGLAKGADVTMAINKAVNQAKKKMIDVPLAANNTIPHEIKHKFGAAQILLRPAAHGRGIICGGVMRRIAELAGLHNVTGKILGTNNNVANAKCMIEALCLLRPVKNNRTPAKATVSAKGSDESQAAKQ